MSAPVANALAAELMRLAQISAGRRFPANSIEVLGGWERITLDVGTLVGEPTLPLLARLVARDAGAVPNGLATAALLAVVDTVLATSQPALFRDSIDALLDAEGATRVTGDRLAAGLLPIVESFFAIGSREPVADMASADALEVLTRVAAAGYGSRFGLFALLERFSTPTVLPMARAAVRSIGTAVDIWPEADSLISCVRALGGLDPVDGADPVLSVAVESDATWVLGMVSVLRSLRADSIKEMAPYVDDAYQFFDVAAKAYGRPDASIMLSVMDALRELIRAIISGTPSEALGSKALSASAIADLQARVLRFSIGGHGLDHWYVESKSVSLAAWANFAGDLDRLRVEFAKDAFYQAEVIVGALLNVYVSDRSFRIHRREGDIAGVQDLVQPVIEAGFATKASHLSNLEQHAAILDARLAKESDEALQEQRDAAYQIIEIVRRTAKGEGAPGKGEGGAPLPPLPALLSRLVRPGSVEENLLQQMPLELQEAIAEGMDGVADGRRYLNIVQREVFDGIRAKLVECSDYKGEVIPLFDEVLLLILNFVVSRTAADSGHYPYLFDEAAKEIEIHEDLYNYLVGNLGARAEYEVSHVGGGRVDLRLKFDRFAIHIEMKVDSTQVSMDDKTAYLKQAASYQGNDIMVGFLIALRHKAFKKGGPAAHLRSLMGHTTFAIPGDSEPRHIVTVAVPGSRTKPSASTAS
ncbi:hypothetical protein [Cryobacterium sp. PAMC25264]|uniref:hypothetical protein n=1 Tax=Cryobacterium sp. PAMC25264 TaxID=2861288 RepID=UPI001C62D78F|nr:hypothetical protein [Cryobacterium sp. PAMC25264]QYF74397.1 hypothetical protein KY500_04095 [Cryobacterium sp. PAMC25264]